MLSWLKLVLEKAGANFLCHIGYQMTHEWSTSLWDQTECVVMQKGHTHTHIHTNIVYWSSALRVLACFIVFLVASNLITHMIVNDGVNAQEWNYAIIWDNHNVKPCNITIVSSYKWPTEKLLLSLNLTQCDINIRANDLLTSSILNKLCSIISVFPGMLILSTLSV